MAISRWVAVGALVCLIFSGYLVHSRRDLTKDTESFLEHLGSEREVIVDEQYVDVHLGSESGVNASASMNVSAQGGFGNSNAPPSKQIKASYNSSSMAAMKARSNSRLSNVQVTKELVEGNMLTKALDEMNLPNRLKIECQLWDLHKETSIKTQFREVTERTAVSRGDTRDQVLPDDLVYVAYAYPQDDGFGATFGSFLYYDEQGKLDYIVTLEKLDGRNDFQQNLKAIGKDPPDCELKDFNFGFQDVKRFCWAIGCKKKNGKKLDNFAPYCSVFEKTDGTYWTFVRDKRVFQSTWRTWTKQSKAAENSEATTSKSIVVSITVALCVFFSE